MKSPLKIRELSKDELQELDRLYHETRDVRVRQRTQIILLAAESKFAAPQIARIVRLNDQSVRNWLRRYEVEGISGLMDKPRSGAPSKVTGAYEQRLLEIVEQRPPVLRQPFSHWTAQRLANFLAAELGIVLSKATVHRVLQRHGVSMDALSKTDGSAPKPGGNQL